MKSSLKSNKKISKILFLFFTLILAILFQSNMVHAASINANVTETNMNSSVLLTGADFIPSTNYSLIPLLENKSAWWAKIALHIYTI